MRAAIIGDVVGPPGCEFLRRKLPAFKQANQVDIVICNGENSASGNGILPQSANFLFDSGVDVITGGNHSLRRWEIQEYLDSHPNLLRPANYPAALPGSGFFVLDAGRFRLLVINLIGQAFLDPADSPFIACDRILAENKADFTIVDFHAEATGEKMALAYYLDGRVSAVVGTHTHVQTADETILEKGTGYISDLGMTGPVRSILGTVPEEIVQRMTTRLPVRFHVPNGPCKMEGVLVDLLERNGKCTKIQRFSLK